jgi:hypothetical protein
MRWNASAAEDGAAHENGTVAGCPGTKPEEAKAVSERPAAFPAVRQRDRFMAVDRHHDLAHPFSEIQGTCFHRCLL